MKLVKIKFLLGLICCFSLVKAISQKNNLTVQFIPCYNNVPINGQNKWFILPNSTDSITIDVFKLYVGNFNVYSSNKTLVNKYFLLNAQNDSSLSVTLPLSKNLPIKSIAFDMGVDSNTVSQGILNSSLDPLNGMYWTWNTGYINAKVEGSCKQCKAFKKIYQLHIGGYKSPFNTHQKIYLPIPSSSQNIKKIIIKIDVATWFNAIDFRGNVSIMQPSLKAMMVANTFANSLSILKTE